MKDGKFKDLIIKAYDKSKKGNLVVLIYSSISTYGFSDIKDINGFAESSNSDMMHLKSKLTDTEADIYEWELEDFKVKESEGIIYIKVKNKREMAFMY